MSAERTQVEAMLLLALEEMRRWPDLPGVQVGVYVAKKHGLAFATVGPNDPLPEPELQRLIVPPERFIGVFEALEAHAQTCFLTGKMALRADTIVDRIEENFSDFIEDLCLAVSEPQPAHPGIVDSAPMREVLAKWGLGPKGTV